MSFACPSQCRLIFTPMRRPDGHPSAASVPVSPLAAASADFLARTDEKTDGIPVVKDGSDANNVGAPSLKKLVLGCLASDEEAARYAALVRESPLSDMPLIGPPPRATEMSPRLIEAHLEERQASRKMLAFLMRMRDEKIRLEARASAPGRKNGQANADDEQVRDLLNKHDRNIEAARCEFVKLHPENSDPASNSKRFTRSLDRIRKREYYELEKI